MVMRSMVETGYKYADLKYFNIVFGVFVVFRKQNFKIYDFFQQKTILK